MIRLAIALFLCGWPALASPQCAPRDDVAKMLSEKYGEIPSRIGMAADGTMMELWASDKGTWSLTFTLPNGATCLASWGDRLEVAPESAKGEPA